MMSSLTHGFMGRVWKDQQADASKADLPSRRESFPTADFDPRMAQLNSRWCSLSSTREDASRACRYLGQVGLVYVSGSELRGESRRDSLRREGRGGTLKKHQVKLELNDNIAPSIGFNYLQLATAPSSPLVRIEFALAPQLVAACVPSSWRFLKSVPIGSGRLPSEGAR